MDHFVLLYHLYLPFISPFTSLSHTRPLLFVIHSLAVNPFCDLFLSHLIQFDVIDSIYIYFASFDSLFIVCTYFSACGMCCGLVFGLSPSIFYLTLAVTHLHHCIRLYICLLIFLAHTHAHTNRNQGCQTIQSGCDDSVLGDGNDQNENSPTTNIQIFAMMRGYVRYAVRIPIHSSASNQKCASCTQH